MKTILILLCAAGISFFAAATRQLGRLVDLEEDIEGIHE